MSVEEGSWSESGHTGNASLQLLPVLPSLVHVLVLLHHDG